ncbi:MAG: OsmC family protein [Eudoraea sp.]|nr:OsmC family protein [Eudoraea sp.]
MSIVTMITLEQVSETGMQLLNDDFRVRVDRPVEKGGNGEGLMGGQYMLVGIGGCYCSTLLAAAQSRDIQISGLSVSVKATISEDLPKRFKDIVLEVSSTSCSKEHEFNKLLKIAEKGCISVNTIKSGLNFSVELK